MGNSDKLQRAFQLVSEGDLDGFFEYLADDFVEHETGPGLAPTKAGTRELFAMLMAGFPDIRFEAEDVIESGDKVVARAHITGTNKGEFMGVPASGKSIDIQAIDIVRFGDDGLVHEHWGVMDVMSMMQQIGAVPSGPPPV
ncbi:MAG TPA: ester cyclase [Acidimicrobiales bacterium]|nr:ester cyclase [Acidimicrobiales bacterium]